MPEPATRSLTVLETSTSPGCAFEATRALVCTAMPATLPSMSSHSPVCRPARTSRPSSGMVSTIARAQVIARAGSGAPLGAGGLSLVAELALCAVRAERDRPAVVVEISPPAGRVPRALAAALGADQWCIAGEWVALHPGTSEATPRHRRRSFRWGRDPPSPSECPACYLSMTVRSPETSPSMLLLPSAPSGLEQTWASVKPGGL